MKTRMNRRAVLTAGGLSGMALVLGESGGEASQKGPGRLLRLAPEQGGLDPNGVLKFLDAVQAQNKELHSVMILRHGKVLAEGWWKPYEPKHPHMLYSLSKSFTSTAVGLVISEGKLALSDKVLSFFPKERPTAPDANLAAMEVRHLLMMGTGHDKDTTGAVMGAADGDWVKAFLALPVEHAPGSKFVYNTGATYMLSAIVQAVTGKTVLEYLKPRLFEPLGIANPTWETCPKGRSTGGFGLSLRTEEIARFGQLYLQKGKWEGKQLVPEAWVAEATQKHISNGDPTQKSDWSQGYGYQFWRCQNGAYRGDGAFCQFCLVLPEKDAVIAITAGSGDYQGILNLVWEHLLPAFRDGARAAPLLSERLQELALPLIKVDPDPRLEGFAKFIAGKTYRFESNALKLETLAVAAGDLVLTINGQVQRIPIPNSSQGWARARAKLGDYPSPWIASQGGWTKHRELALKVCAYETPYVYTLTCQFVSKGVKFTMKTNVGFGPTESPTLEGKEG